MSDAFAPSAETVSQVRNWLKGAGIDDTRVMHTDNKGWLAFVASGKELEGLLHTEYSYYTNNKTSKTVVATEQYVYFSHFEIEEGYLHLWTYNAEVTDRI